MLRRELAFAKKLREGELLQEEYSQVVEDFKEDWEKYFVVEVSENACSAKPRT